MIKYLFENLKTYLYKKEQQLSTIPSTYYIFIDLFLLLLALYCLFVELAL